jgi:radical SAM protein with 4Fe4S-binding SPASM domain
MYVELNNACNYACSYCYVGEKKAAERKVWQSQDSLQALLAWGRETGVDEAIFLGGEPTLYPHFRPAVQMAADLQFASVGVVTNGSRLSSDLCAFLKDRGAWANLTMRGGHPATFNGNARRQAAWRQFSDALTAAGDAGLRAGVEYDVTPNNFMEIGAAVRHCVSLNPRLEQFQLHRIMPFGDASEWGDDRLVTLDQWREVLSQVDTASETYRINIFVEDGLPMCAFEQRYWRFLRPCSCGRTSFTVDTGGGARACSCNGEWARENLDFATGRRPLANIQAERRDLVDQSICGTCQIRDRCWGGCPNSTRYRREAFAEALNPVAGRARNG